MSENEENRWVGPFVLGFLLGVLLCLGGGGTYVYLLQQRAWEEAVMHRRMAEEAQAEAEMARREAERRLKLLELEKAEKAKGKE